MADLRGSEEDTFDVYEAPRRGMSSGFKAALIGCLGCGGCLGLAAVLALTFGAGLVQSFMDSAQVANEFLEAVGEERFDDAWIQVDPAAFDRDAFDAAMAELSTRRATWGKEVRAERTQMTKNTHNGRTAFHFGFAITYEGDGAYTVEGGEPGEVVEVDLELIEVDEQWRVSGLRWADSGSRSIELGTPPEPR
ncbi:hypothetical protein [Planctomycetes bacterium Pla163]